MLKQSSVRLLNNRLIGFFDILGFSDRLRTEDVMQLHEMYSGLIDKANSTVFSNRSTGPDGRNFDKFNFAKSQFLFDSIVLVSNELEEGSSVSDFIFGCIQLMELSMSKKLPLRGAISFGDFLDDEGRGVFLSPCFAELAKCEKDQAWSGCIILPEADRIIEAHLYGSYNAHSVRASYPVVRYVAALKSGAKYQGKELFCLNWCYLMSRSDLTAGLEFMNKEKKPATLAFVSFVDGLTDDASMLPAEALPAVKMRYQSAKTGLRVAFFDKGMSHVDPACPVTLSLAEPGSPTIRRVTMQPQRLDSGEYAVAWTAWTESKTTLSDYRYTLWTS